VRSTRAGRDAQRHQQHASVDGDVRHAWNDRRAGGDERAHAPHREQQSRDTTRCREQRALDEHLRDEPRPRRAECGSDGQLFLPRRGACEQHVGHVGARDEQHERDGTKQHEQRRRDIADDDVLERLHRDVAIRARVLALEPRRHCRQIDSCLLERHARSQTGEESEALPSAIRRARAECEWRPKLGVRRPEWRELKGRRHDADDRERVTVEQHAPTDHSAIARESALPQTVADHRDVFVAGHVLLRREHAAEQWAHAKHRKHAGGESERGDALGLVGAGEIHRPVFCGGDVGEASRLLPPIEKVGRCDRIAIVVQQHDEAIAVRVRQWTQQHAVHDAQDRGSGTDPEREGQRRRDREGGSLEERANPELDIATHVNVAKRAGR
jgi:hypothetical protein